MIAAAAVLAVMVGALGGAIASALRAGLLLGGVLTAGAYLADLVFIESVGLKTATLFLPLVALTFLTSWLTARLLEARLGLPRVWAASLAFVCALLTGFLCMLLGRVGLLIPVWAALAADLGLIGFIVIPRIRKAA